MPLSGIENEDMIHLYKKHYWKLKCYSEQLRNHSTRPERRLWYRIGHQQVLGVQFYQQSILSNYILDFYAPEIKLAIELDGDQHYEPQNRLRDKIRDDYLNFVGIQVLRFSNLEVMRELDAVLDVIYETVEMALERKRYRDWR